MTRFLSAIALMACLAAIPWHSAAAQPVQPGCPSPGSIACVAVHPVTGLNTTDCTLTLTGSAQTLVAAGASLEYIEFQDVSLPPHPVAFSFTSAAPVLNSIGMMLDSLRGWTYNISLPALPAKALTVIGTSGDILACHYQ